LANMASRFSIVAPDALDKARALFISQG